MGCMPACIWDDNGRADEATAETALTFKAERRSTLVLCSSESEEGTRARADREPRKREAWMDEWILDRSRDEEGGRKAEHKRCQGSLFWEKSRKKEIEKFGLAGRGQAKPFNLGWICGFSRSHSFVRG